MSCKPSSRIALLRENPTRLTKRRKRSLSKVVRSRQLSLSGPYERQLTSSSSPPDTVETQPLDQKLDANVRKYQEKLFDAREVNAKERIDAPQRVAEVSACVILCEEGRMLTRLSHRTSSKLSRWIEKVSTSSMPGALNFLRQKVLCGQILSRRRTRVR